MLSHANTRTKRSSKLLWLVTFTFATASVSALGCPFSSGGEAHGHIRKGEDHFLRTTKPQHGKAGTAEPDFSKHTYEALQKDIVAALIDSKDFWPADFGNYAPFMIRLAWHCAGSYRQSDGRGGCDGSRIRFNPERNWADNTNLDKALDLLQPIKLKYGDTVSMGDIITLTGNMAVSSMGGPIIGFCAGRREDRSGFDSMELGPTPEQEAVAPCAVNGTCEAPLGTSTVGLIYVNPEGPLGVPDPEGSVDKIRDVFGRMGMNDSETVALIGGGHAFGKVHGACTTGAGPDPTDAPHMPWPGTCGDPESPDFGRGENTYTSGFEGQWTEEPTTWDNAYFKELLEYDWAIADGPGGRNQWYPILKAESNETEVPDIIMLTTDIALLKDHNYLAIVEKYATDQAALDVSFSNAWYKLTTRDMGPYTRCEGTDVPPPQDFQLPLPEVIIASPSSYRRARIAIADLLFSTQSSISPDVFRGVPSYAALFVTLAWQCASTFRSTDYMGGCNGARIRFSPQKDWPSNIRLDSVLQVLEPVKTEFPDMSYADIIVLAGNVALDESYSLDLPFCEGRADALGASDLISVLEPRKYDDAIAGVRDRMKIMGLSVAQMVALAARPRSPSHMIRLGYSGSYTQDPTAVSNVFFNTLLSETWESVPGSDVDEYQAVGNADVYALSTDLALIWDPEFKAQAVMFAGNNDLFLDEFKLAWTAVMNADRFNGPFDNRCDDY